MITRVTPLPSQASAVAMSRMPPPSCTGMLTISRMRSTAPAFIGLPAKAPSRSTRCRYLKPCASNVWAWLPGSRLNTVARFMSPCCRRTQTPSFRSIAGNRITASHIQLEAQSCNRRAARPLPSPLGGRIKEGGELQNSRAGFTPLPTALRAVDLPLKGGGEEGEHRAGVTASTSGSWRSARGRAAGSFPGGTACRRNCRGRPPR